MKYIKKIIVWGLLSLFIQFVGFFYINNYYLTKGTGNMKIKKVEKKEEKKKDIDIDIPEGVKNITVSFNGKYVAYYDEKGIDVINTITGERKKVQAEKGAEINNYTWLSNQSRMLIGEKISSNNGGTTLKLTYYDAGKDEKGEISDTQGNLVNLAKLNKDASIKDISISTFTNTTYVKSQQAGNRCTLYRVNIMHEISKVEAKSYLIGNIKALPREDNLLYEDLTYKKIYSTEMKNPIEIPGLKSPTILGVDDNDLVYLGDKDEDKIKKIFYGKLKDSAESWKKIDMDLGVDKEDIYISNSGQIYINNNLKGTIKEAISDKEITYEGKFLHMYEGGIVSISQGKLVKTKVE
ncbi:hypothetical protein [Clostridium amazonitimonense]|uniref:hypothetical protein n=1 Tax=Clostridium amazonitimonense TaxID=1499689 RepID=UPI000509F7CC|nr:hypothetical protein [Clostridium amazonitimonense]